VTFRGVAISVFARNGEQMREDLCGLSHVQADDRIGQSPLESDDRLQEARPQRGKLLGLAPDGLRCRQAAEPVACLVSQDQRRMRQRLRAAGQDDVDEAVLDVAEGDVDRLHARAAVDLNGERDHVFTETKPQGRHPRGVHLVSDDVHTAENDHVCRGGRAGLAQQQRASALHGEIDGRERPGPSARLDEWRSRTVDYVDRPAHSAAVWFSTG
jgi:hypothetical protein